MHWKKARIRQIKVTGWIKVKTFKQRIVIRGKDYGEREKTSKNRTFAKWSKKEEQRAMLLRQQGKSYRYIQRATKRTYESVRSKILRTEGKKKK